MYKATEPEAEIIDYWNAWSSQSLAIEMYKENKKFEWLKFIRLPVQTFEEYRNDQFHDTGSPKHDPILIHQLNRLASIYNLLSSKEELDINKLGRIIEIAHEKIYDFHE